MTSGAAGCSLGLVLFHLSGVAFVLVTALHNEIRDKVADLAGKAFTPSHVRDYP